MKKDIYIYIYNYYDKGSVIILSNGQKYVAPDLVSSVGQTAALHPIGQISEFSNKCTSEPAVCLLSL